MRTIPANPSATLRALNPQIYGPSVPKDTPEQPRKATQQPRVGVLMGKQGVGSGKGIPRARKAMNKTESAYAAILEAERKHGDIKRWEREGITLRWPDGMCYTGDFTVWNWNVSGDSPTDGPHQIEIIETKGGFIRDDALVKFRAARAHWPEFVFRMMQYSKREWRQIL